MCALPANKPPMSMSASQGPSELDKSAVDTLRNTAHAAHYELCEHYSGLIFKARVSIITLTLLVIAFVFDIVPARTQPLPPILGFDARGLMALMSSVLIGLLHLMEMAYIKRFYQVVASGKAIEQGLLPSYFARYDRAESWPVHLAYGVGILVMTGSFVALAWLSNQSLKRTTIILFLAGVPIALFLWSQLRLMRSLKSILSNWK